MGGSDGQSAKDSTSAPSPLLGCGASEPPNSAWERSRDTAVVVAASEQNNAGCSAAVARRQSSSASRQPRLSFGEPTLEKQSFGLKLEFRIVFVLIFRLVFPALPKAGEAAIVTMRPRPALG